ncbi:hypothetical protein SAMN02799626_00106 [Caulobacter sp. UNC279MFTsu5.1]|nr:hypothetical protein SAMN02799626_00106 [Caulobacter sp. UNC279MFTsu5.1]
MDITVLASTDEVRRVLEEELGPDALAGLAISDAPQDPFAPAERGEALTLAALVTWTAGAVAGGVVGNAAYDALKAAAAALIKRFGAQRVVVEEEPEA